MASEHDTDEPRDDPDAVRRAAQDSAGELARMGIDPRALGLEPAPPILPASAPPAESARPVASAPPVASGDRPGAVPGAGTARGVARLDTVRGGPANRAESMAVPAPPGSAAIPPPPGPVGVPTPPGPVGVPGAAGFPAPPDQVAGVATGRAFVPTTYGRPLVPEPAGAEGIDSTLSRPIGSLVQMAAPSTEYLQPLAQIVAPVNLRPAAAARRMVRAVTFGLLNPGAAATIERERQLVARARLRRPEPRVIAFLAGKGGVGTTSTAAGVALTLATVRADQPALVSLRAGGSALGQRLLGQPAPPLPVELGDDEPAVEPLWVHGSLAVIDGPPWHTPVRPEPLGGLLDQLRSRHPLTLIDVGTELGEAAQRAVTRADQVVLVTSASLDAIAAVQLAMSRVHQVDPFRLSTLVVALVCLNSRQYRRVLHRLRAELGVRGPRIVPVRFDPWLAAGSRIEPVRLRAATREAYLQLAGLVVEPGNEQQWFAQPGRTPPPGGGASPPHGTMLPPGGVASPPHGTMLPPGGGASPPHGTMLPPGGMASPPHGTPPAGGTAQLPGGATAGGWR